MKKGKLSKAEIFYIENSKATAEEIAKELNRSVNVVKKHIPESNAEPTTQSDEVSLDKEKKEPQKSEGKINKYLNKQDGSFVLTPAGSQRGDLIKSSKKSQKTESAIFRPFNK